MASEFLKAEVIAAAALGLLERETVLAQFVTRLAEADFRGARNDSVTVRIPARLDAREYEWRNNRAQPIELDDIVETGIDVKLDTMLYSAVPIDDEILTLDIQNFGEQVLAVQARAMVRKMEQALADMIEGAPFAFTITEADPFLAVAKARAQLNKNSVPMDGRVLLLGADVETVFLSSPLLVRVDTSGSPSALRDASIGRIAGFDCVVSQFLTPDVAYAVHQSGFAFANVAPLVPDGATYGQSQTYGGFATRWLRDYDAMYLRDRSVLSSFIGCNSVNDGVQLDDSYEDQNVRAVKIEGIGAASNGGGGGGGP